MNEVGAIVILLLLSCLKWPPATIFFARRRAIKKLVWGLLQVAHGRSNVSLLKILPYSPELNPCEQVCQYIKDQWLKNRCYKDYDDILSVAVEAWQNFTAENGRIRSLCSRDWASI